MKLTHGERVRILAAKFGLIAWLYNEAVKNVVVVVVVVVVVGQTNWEQDLSTNFVVLNYQR